MILILLVWAAYIFGVLQVLFHGFRIGSFLSTVAVFAVLFVVLMVWSVRRLVRAPRRAGPARQPAAPPPAADDSGSVTFRVAGTTFDNDDGESRQEILRHLRFGDKPWADDPEDLNVSILETEFEGQLAFAVLINDYQVGFVPKNMISRVSAAREHVATCYVSGVRIIGGGQDANGNPLSYGCEITLEY